MISRQYRMSPGPQRRSGGLLPIILAILFILVINSVLSGGGYSGATTASAVTSGATTSSANEQLGMQMAAAAGYGKPQRRCLNLLWTHESGWRADAQNASSAYGIAQFLDTTWAPYGPKTSVAALQIKYGLEYIHDRYGTPCKAWTFEMSHTPNWY